MRLAYACYLSTIDESGVMRKLESQVAVWRDAGHDTRLHILVPESGATRDRRLGLEASGTSIVTFGSNVGRLMATHELARGVRRQAPDLVHMRYDIFAPPLPLLFPRDLPLVVDVQTDDRGEYRHRRRAARAYNAVQRRLVMKRASGVVAAAGGLLEAWVSTGKPCIVVSNGYDFGAVRPLPAPANERPRLVFLGKTAPWQGADKLVALARLLPDMDIHIVGFTADRFQDPPANVTFYGVLKRAEYEPVLARADAAIGSLALHRNAMTEASPLKVREYLAYGLPTVIAYDDTDFPAPMPFLLQLPNTEHSIDGGAAERVREFLALWRGRRVPRDAVAHLDIRVKEATRLEFMESLVGES
jgi:glycosyltransferase involved in cell wall biosynthesis